MDDADSWSKKKKIQKITRLRRFKHDGVKTKSVFLAEYMFLVFVHYNYFLYIFMFFAIFVCNHMQILNST